MGDFGMIHEKLDIKILILFVLRRLPEAVSREQLAELVLCDKGVGYFDYAQCLLELVDTGHAEETERGYIITEKGSLNGATIESSLPYSVRQAAERRALSLARVMRRYSMIGASHAERSDGCVSVTLSLFDGVGEIIDMRVLVPDEDAALRIESSFRARAEDIYNNVLAILLEDE